MQAMREHRSIKLLLSQLPDYLSLLLVILCGFLLARLLWALYPREATTFDDLFSQTQTPVQTTTDTPHAGEQIAAAHLFGQVAVEAPSKNLRTSQLAFKLVGVLSGPTGQAVLEYGGKQENHRVGEAIMDGVILQAVFADHIVILRNGTQEKIALPALTETTTTAYDSNVPSFTLNERESPAAVTTERLPDNADEPVDVPPNLPSGMSPEPPEMNVPPEDLPETNSAVPVPMNAQQFSEIVVPQPHEVNGKFVGFRLMPGSNVGLFNHFGLQSGDIVTAINGTLLDSPAAGVQALNAAAASSQINLSLIRGGQRFDLPISLRR